MDLRLWGLLILVIGGSSVIFDPIPTEENAISNETYDVNFTDNYGNNETVGFLNFGLNRSELNQRYRIQYLENPERILQTKVNVLARLLKIHVDQLRDKTEQVELVFLVDSSASVGAENFRSELNFVRKLLSDFTVEPTATRVALVTFAGRRHIRRHIDQISRTSESDHKCYLLNKQLDNITYTGGGTYTRGALLEALAILQNSRKGSEKIVFLITDGFSNSGDPRPAAAHLKSMGAIIFTFGIRTGNVEELHDIASKPGYTHSYLLDSFPEFEALARRALHRDLKSGRYVPVRVPSDCNWLCLPKNESKEVKQCCDDLATCACGTATGHYACLCPRGYFGSGLKGFCQPCPNGTFDQGGALKDSSTLCSSCPDANHVTIKVPAISVDDCVCAEGFITDGENCEESIRKSLGGKDRVGRNLSTRLSYNHDRTSLPAMRCPKLRVPENGYFVKASACSNVVNAACGLRCRIGFNLIGDSIRLCRKDGIWSGVEPQCLLKTCAALRAPTHGRIRCEHDEDEKKKKAENLTDYPIDTRCQFKCDNGYQLRGSKVRNCLPLSRWDGLKVTCKQIKCEPLRPLANGKITPDTCTGSTKLPFSTNCTFTCDQGFILKGPKNRHCSGKNGVWSQRHTANHCVDKTPPVITCPLDSTWETLPGKNYALVKWKIPIASDNSNKVPNVWSKPHFSLPWKAEIGSHKIVYVAQDATGNKAKCKFLVRVVDKEPPVVENCVDPPTYLTVKKPGKEVITWDEPIFYDNSKTPVTITRSHSKPECNCSIGTTQIFYNASDASENSVNCVLNVTVEDACKDVPILSNGQANCQMIEGEGVQCVFTCEEGYGFAVYQPDSLDASGTSIILTCGLDETAWNGSLFPDCSATEIPTSVGRDGSVVLQGNTSVCENSTILRQLSDRITEDLSSNMLEICGNDINCNLVRLSDPICEIEVSDEKNIDSNVLGRRKRQPDDNRRSKANSLNSRSRRIASKIQNLSKVQDKQHKQKSKTQAKRKRGKIEIKLRFVGKIVSQYRNNPELGIQKLREKIQSLTASGQLNLLNNKTNYEIAKLALNLNTIFKDARELCDTGHVLKKHNCTKCPMGTFHNETRDQCQACSFGEYQNSVGASKCIKCPHRTFTRKMHSKNVSNCQPICRPGYFARRKQNQVSDVGLEPCTTCDIGFYQADYGRMFCNACPDNGTTADRGTSSIDQCFPSVKIENPCITLPCLNGGHCVAENSSFSCECRENYVGSICEKLQNPCDSQPCLNEGECSVGNANRTTLSYFCHCRSGFTGQTCETYIDECVRNPCKNGGSCVSTEKDYNCICRDGFEGDFCETAVNHCETWTCEEGSTCMTIEGTWKCLCKPGFLGLRCNLLPCDWIPCHRNAICLNVEHINVTRNSYRCVCPTGYEGDDCTTRIDNCRDFPCLNGGTCVNGLSNYTCDCLITFSGVNCETELSPEYILQFSEIGTTDYVIMKGPKMDLTELTICLWLQSEDTFNYGTVMSYATKDQDNTFTLTDYNGFVLYVNGEKVVTDITVNDGYWHFLCIDWESDNGSWHAYVDGVLKDNGTLLAKESFIAANGSIVIGQEQDQVGGGFSASEAFLGKLSYFDVWDTILGQEAIENLTHTCEKYHGSIIAWAQMRLHIRGSVSISDSIFCRGCPSPVVLLNGNINISNDDKELIYFCEIGYSVRVGNWIGTAYKRSCLKYGEWEGYNNPICTKVKCGYPGYFPRGQVHGRSFMYGDEIQYSCAEGYELRGNPHRFCNADGNWSGLQPICIGLTCKNLLAPENGDIEYVIEEHERDDISILQVGQQLEFKCNPGFHLSGERYLTCLDSGKWDFGVPICAPSGCPAPKLLQHGYISTNQFAILPIYNKSNLTTPVIEEPSEKESSSPFYSFGDIVGLSCHEGFKFQGNRNLLVEFRLQCSTNGTWSGLVPDCVRLRCPSPQDVANGRIIVTFDDETELEISSQRKASQQLTNSTKHETEDSDESENAELKFFSELLEEDDKTGFPADQIQETLVPGTKISVICDRGYELNGEAMRICLENEIWSSAEPECIRIHCPTQIHPIIGILAEKFNQSAKNISQEITDEDGNIRGDTFEDTTLLFKGSYYGDEVVFACKNDKNFNSGTLGTDEPAQNLTWSCDEDGKWKNRNGPLNETVFENSLKNRVNICEGMICGPPQIPSNGYIVNASNITEEITNRKINSTVIFRCQSGFDIEGSDEATCLTSGIWSAIPACKPVSCKNPPKVTNAILEESTSISTEYVFGNKIAYKCIPGYRIFGQSNARCLANGKWSRVHGKCSKISCGKPNIPPGVTVYGRSYLYQEQLSYKCQNGGPKGSITCKSDGKWSDPPVCPTKN